MACGVPWRQLGELKGDHQVRDKSEQWQNVLKAVFKGDYTDWRKETSTMKPLALEQEDGSFAWSKSRTKTAEGRISRQMLKLCHDSNPFMDNYLQVRNM